MWLHACTRRLIQPRSSPVSFLQVLCNGGIVSIDTLIHMGANKTSNGGAIIEAFNPVDHGTRAVAESIFGGANRWGKLPVTIYPSNYTAALDAAGAGIANYVREEKGRKRERRGWARIRPLLLRVRVILFFLMYP